MDLLGQSALLVALTSFSLGFSVLARNVRNALYIAFAVLCTFVSLWSLFFSLEKIFGDGSFYLLHLILNVWLAPAGLAFIRVMVRVRDRFSRRLTDLSVFGAVGLSVALLMGWDSAPWIKNLILFLPALIVIQTVYLMWIDRRLRKGLKRLPKRPTVGFARRNLIYIGGLAVLCLSVMDHIPEIPAALPTLGNLGLVVYLFFMSRAITQQRLLNLGALVSRFIVLIAVAATLTGVYSLLVAWIENSPGLFILNSFVASFIILMLLDPLRALVAYSTDKLLSARQQSLQEKLREANRALSGVTELSNLSQKILQTVELTLEPEWAALFLLRRDGTRFRRVRMIGREPAHASGEPSPLRELLAEHALFRQVALQKKRDELPMVLDSMLESEMERTTSRLQRESLESLRQTLKALGGNLLAPIHYDGKIMGFVIIRALSAPEPWGNNWGLLQIIAPYFELAGRVIADLDVYSRQREKERLATLGEMAAGLAHEIRNPLGAIKGAAQLLDPNTDRPDSRFLKIIVEEVDRLNQVVTQFLDYSKPDSAERVDTPLFSLVERAVLSLQPGLPTSVRLELTKGARAEELTASVAPHQIHQVLVNLIQNAVRALEGRRSPEMPGVIRVSLESEGQGSHRQAALTVEDNGPGIRRENLEKIFIPFFTTSSSGTGLGLSICQKLIEAHQGRIEVSSEEGRYARFTVTLPCPEGGKRS